MNRSMQTHLNAAKCISVKGFVMALRQLATSLSPWRDLGLIPGQSTWNLWWTKQQQDKFSSKYYSFPLPVSFYQCFLIKLNSTNNDAIYFQN